jgi:hypothetical protein
MQEYTNSDSIHSVEELSVFETTHDASHDPERWKKKTLSYNYLSFKDTAAKKQSS